MTTACDLPIDLSTKNLQSHHHHHHHHHHNHKNPNRHHRHKLHHEDSQPEDEQDFLQADKHIQHHLAQFDHLHGRHLLDQNYNMTRAQLEYQNQLNVVLALDQQQQSQLSRLYAATDHHRHQLEQLEIQIELARRSVAIQSSPPHHQTHTDHHHYPHHRNLKSHLLQYHQPRLALHIAVRQDTSCQQNSFGTQSTHQDKQDRLNNTIAHSNDITNTLTNANNNVHHHEHQMPPIDLHRSSTSSTHSTSSSSSASISSTSLYNTNTNQNSAHINNHNPNSQNSNINDNRYSHTPVNICSNPDSPQSQSSNQNDKKKTNRPLTGKHVKHGTGASIQTLATLRNVLKQRQQTCALTS